MEKHIPKYHETFIPVLRVLNDDGVLHYNELRKRVRDRFYGDLPQELLEQKTKSGDILILNRIGWAKAYLKQAGMVRQPTRAFVEITDKGKKVLAAGELTLKDLLNDAEFQKNRNTDKSDSELVRADEHASPEEMIESGVATIEAQQKHDLLDRLRTVDPYYFEKIILELLNKMGYGEYTTTAKSGDGGIDGVINQDKLGLEKIYVQAKRYSENKVREPSIREFIGAMSRDTQKGIFVTTSTFDDSAKKKAHDAQHKIVLIDGVKLADLMYQYGVGVQVKKSYEIREVDEDFFIDS